MPPDSLRVAFAGTPEFAATALAAIGDAGFRVVGVLTQPDRPAGRGLALQASPVKQLALARGWSVAQPRSLRLDGRWPDDAHRAAEVLAAWSPQVLVVAAYGLILPRWVLDQPSLGCLNIHASLLPRWRGAAPIHRAVEAGDVRTGITIMQMDEGLDTGDMLLREAVSMGGGETTGQLHDRLAAIGAVLIVRALHAAAQGQLVRERQPVDGVCYAHKITKAEAAMDWSRDATGLQRTVLALNPAPGASTLRAGQLLKVWTAHALSPDHPGAVRGDSAAPGTVIAVTTDGIDVACGAGVLRITQCQAAGGRRQDGAALAASARDWVGQHLG